MLGCTTEIRPTQLFVGEKKTLTQFLTIKNQSKRQC